MKYIIEVILVLAVLQVTLARKSQTIKPPTDKRYPLFDFIATKVNQQTAQELLIDGEVYIKLFQYVDALMDTHKEDSKYNFQSHQTVKEALAEIQASVQNFKEGKMNCVRQQEYRNHLSAFKSKYEMDMPDFDDEHELETLKTMYSETQESRTTELRMLLKQIYAGRPEIIESFMLNLNDSEKEENADLVKWCQDFMAAKNTAQQFIVLQGFFQFFAKELNTNEDNDVDCKWELEPYEDLMVKMSMWLSPEMLMSKTD